jgi:ketosteroid isomerase-like protein
MAVEETKNNDEAAIQRLLDDAIRALHDKNIEGIMSIYAPEVVSFDIAPPLQYKGADAFRNVWEEVFSVFQGPITYELLTCPSRWAMTWPSPTASTGCAQP